MSRGIQYFVLLSQRWTRREISTVAYSPETTYRRKPEKKEENARKVFDYCKEVGVDDLGAETAEISWVLSRIGDISVVIRTVFVLFQRTCALASARRTGWRPVLAPYRQVVRQRGKPYETEGQRWNRTRTYPHRNWPGELAPEGLLGESRVVY